MVHLTRNPASNLPLAHEHHQGPLKAGQFADNEKMRAGPAKRITTKETYLQKVGMVSAAGFEPTAPGFIPLQLSLPVCYTVRGLDCLLTLISDGNVRSRPFSLYTFVCARQYAWLGIGTALNGQSFPRF